jgi:hypothetical protein
MTFEKFLAAWEHTCPFCKREGLMRDVRAEKDAQAKYGEFVALKTEFMDLDRHLYPLTTWQFEALEYGCPECGGEDYCEAIPLFTTRLFKNSHLVQCMNCNHIYNWPVTDIRELDKREEVVETASQVEQGLRRTRDAQLREVFPCP